MARVLPCPLQEQAKLFLCGGCPATHHLIGFRNTREYVDNQTEEISLRVRGAGVEWLGGVTNEGAMVEQALCVLEGTSPMEGVAFEEDI